MRRLAGASGARIRRTAGRGARRHRDRQGLDGGGVGAGAGYITWRLAERVGPGGKVYANDIQQKMLGLLFTLLSLLFTP